MFVFVVTSGKDGKILQDHRQNGNVAVGGIIGNNLATLRPIGSKVRYNHNKLQQQQ